MNDFWEEMESKSQVEVKVEVGEIRTGWQYQQSEMLKIKLYVTYVCLSQCDLKVSYTFNPINWLSVIHSIFYDSLDGDLNWFYCCTQLHITC